MVDPSRGRFVMAPTATVPGPVWAFAEHEHRDLGRGLDRVHDLACGIPDWVEPELSTHLLGVLEWFDHVLSPHAKWEESWLYPQIERRPGATWAALTARFDHSQIRQMADRIREDHQRLLEGDGRAVLPELRCHLFGLEALLRSHIEREERYLIPLLIE
jgi:hemerythrin-like domain-containing protein